MWTGSQLCKECFKKTPRPPRLSTKERIESEANKRKYKAKWYQTNKQRIHEQRIPPTNEKVRQYQYKYQYDIEVSEFDLTYIAQYGKCDICGIFMEYGNRKTRPVLDHDHITGEVRGIICHRCNVGLGFFDDSRVKLRLAIKYLSEGV